MGFLDDLMGNSAADAAKAAAADTYAKQQAAAKGIQDYGDTFASRFEGMSRSFDPWAATGRTANDAVTRLLSDPSSVRGLPGYNFEMGEGVKALDRSAASKGTLFSGQTGKALTEYGQNFADSKMMDWLTRLFGISGQGLDAVRNSVSTLGTGLQGQLGTRQSAYQGLLQAAPTIGQGDIAAANAKARGAQNILNVAANGIGTAMGAGGFGGGLGSNLGSAAFSAYTGGYSPTSFLSKG